MLTALLVVSALSVSGHTDIPLDMTDDGLDDPEATNETEALGEILGGPCEDSCKETLMHVSCNKKTQLCECEPGYPVRVGAETGCAKPVNLGEQCFYYQTCMFADPNADCVQIKHNAVCQCKDGFHLATVQKPQKRSFCSQDLVVIATNLSTLLGVASGLAIFTALICFVLKLFSGSRPRHYANTNLAPPIIFAQSERLICIEAPTIHQMDPKVISLSITSGNNLLRQQHAKSMSGVSVLRGGFTGGSRGVLVPSSRAGAARAAAILLISCHLSPSHGNRRASVHSSTSSTKSFSARQYERERENRLLAKARERERGDGGSASPRSMENLIDGPLPSESWPHLEEVKGKAFSPDMLDDPPDIPFPDIDQMEGFENPFAIGMENPLQTHGIENPLGSLVHPGMKIGDPVGRPRRVEPLGQQVVRIGDIQAQQTLRITDPLEQQTLRLGEPLRVMRIPDPQNPEVGRVTDPLSLHQTTHELQGHGMENSLAPQSDPLNAT